MRQQRKRLVGRVTSDKMDKTVVVTVDQLKRHPLYNKVVRRAHKYKAHNAGNLAKLGDVVQIIESQPLSRDKRWAVESILQKAEA
jgi:small subunit ribosomal protein S17